MCIGTIYTNLFTSVKLTPNGLYESCERLHLTDLHVYT